MENQILGIVFHNLAPKKIQKSKVDEIGTSFGT